MVSPRHCDILNQTIYTSVTGTFYNSTSKHYNVVYIPDDLYCIGIIININQKIPLVISQNDIHGSEVEPIVLDGAWIEAGTAVAQIKSKTGTPHAAVDHNKYSEITAPADGFLIQTDINDMPIQKTENRLRHGDLIAIIEFMKIRIELTFAGPDNSIFKGYTGSSQRPVKSGDLIAVYQIPDNPDPADGFY